MRVAKGDVDVRMEVPGVVIRQRTDFGDVTGFDRISGEYFTLAAGVDTTPLFIGLEGNLCQCPHWGFVLRGELTTTDAAGAQETVCAKRTAECMEEARLRGDIPVESDTRHMASLLVDCWEGAALRSRLRGNASPLTPMLDFFFQRCQDGLAPAKRRKVPAREREP